MQAKEQFIAQKELAAWWSSVSSDTRFDTMMLFAGNVAFEACPSAEQREGILRFKEILLTLSQPNSAPVSFAKTGLIHDLDRPRKTVSTKTEKPAK
jgi:hypothetical protein